MNHLSLQLIRPASASCTPGETIEGLAEWNLERAARRLVVQLIWHTAGIGTVNRGLGRQWLLEEPTAIGRQGFAFEAPNMPQSYDGHYLSIFWTMVLFTEPETERVEIELVISPTRRPLRPAPDARLDRLPGQPSIPDAHDRSREPVSF